jgi:hypothetical protein
VHKHVRLVLIKLNAKKLFAALVSLIYSLPFAQRDTFGINWKFFEKLNTDGPARIGEQKSLLNRITFFNDGSY